MLHPLNLLLYSHAYETIKYHFPSPLLGCFFCPPESLTRFIPTELNWFFHSIESIECCWYNWLISLHNSSIALKNEFTTGNRNIKNAFNCNQTAFACCKNIAECSRTQREVSIMFVALLAAAEARTPQFAVIETEIRNFTLDGSINYVWVTLWSNWRRNFLMRKLIDLWRVSKKVFDCSTIFGTAFRRILRFQKK